MMHRRGGRAMSDDLNSPSSADDGEQTRGPKNRLLIAFTLIALAIMALYAERAFVPTEFEQEFVETLEAPLHQFESISVEEPDQPRQPASLTPPVPRSAPQDEPTRSLRAPVESASAPNALKLQKTLQDPKERIAVLEKEVDEQASLLQTMKRSGVKLEVDEKGQREVKHVQELARELVHLKYGPEPYLTELALTFPETMPDYDTVGAPGKILVEMAPVQLMPYAVLVVLDMAQSWNGGSFHRNAPHVKQATVNRKGIRRLPMAFQEYSAEFPHVKYTLGFAGRPGGPAFYISTVDNTRNHGPGSQKKGTTEADTCFAKVVEGFDVVDRMKGQPGGSKPNGFVNGKENLIKIDLAFASSLLTNVMPLSSVLALHQ